MSQTVDIILQNLPHKPGVYLHKDRDGNILYVGKAKDLRKRVQSYFRASANLDEAKQAMVQKIEDIEIITVRTEEEALILEATLIKKFKPPYNVIFIDDKAYKFIKIDYTEDFPKIYTTRRVVQDGSRYFGPFTNGFAVMETLNMLRKIFPYRTCNFELDLAEGDTDETKKKFIPRPCLYYHIKRCDAPCVGYVSRGEYMKNISAIESFLDGDIDEIVNEIRKRMGTAAKNREFERAAKYRDQLKDIEHVISRQRVVTERFTSYDAIHLSQEKSLAYINLFLIRDGKLMGRENFTVSFQEGTADTEILASFVKDYYQKTLNIPKEILVPEKIEEQDAIARLITQRAKNLGEKYKVRLTVPVKGDKKKILEMSQDNAEEFKKRQVLLHDRKNERVDAALSGITKALGLPKRPKRIEIYDMSNIQGTSAVGSMVVFTDGHPDKKYYRRFRIESFNSPNDVGMMTEVLTRRLHKIHDDEEKKRWPKPDLIILDGGKPQHKAAREAFRAVGFELPFVSLAKREEEVFVPGRTEPIRFPKDSQELYLFQRMRDEAHRFAITYHRNVRSKKAYVSALDSIEGIGPKKKRALLQNYGSVSAIAKAPLAELATLIGESAAKKVQEQLG